MSSKAILSVCLFLTCRIIVVVKKSVIFLNYFFERFFIKFVVPNIFPVPIRIIVPNKIRNT